MLPEILSNGLCSLNPHVDRLCMVCEMLIDSGGEVTRAKFYDAVMQSHARLTYNDVAKMLVEGDTDLAKKHAKLMPDLRELYALYGQCEKRVKNVAQWISIRKKPKLYSVKIAKLKKSSQSFVTTHTS
jgi:ribonuclease R